LNPHGLLAH